MAVKNTELSENLYYAETQFSKRLKTKSYLFIKRLFDFLASLAALILLSPLMLILAILVYLDDPGKVFYGHLRIGKNGKPFKVWKFRSMYMNADKMIDLLTPEQAKQYYTEFKIDNDPRITKIGNFLRKTSLDELPQLFNVLCNDMSLVGPRPLIESEIQTYYADMYDNIASRKTGRDGLLAGIRTKQCNLSKWRTAENGNVLCPQCITVVGHQDSV